MALMVMMVVMVVIIVVMVTMLMMMVIIVHMVMTTTTGPMLYANEAAVYTVKTYHVRCENIKISGMTGTSDDSAA